MTTAKALLIASIATAPILAALAAPMVGALGLPDAGSAPDAPLPTPDDAACAAQSAAPRLVWTPCATKADFDAGNLTVAGHALVGGALFANALGANAIDTGGAVRAGSITVAGTASAANAAVSDTLRATNVIVDGCTELGVVQMRVANASPACAEGTLALVRNADGSDALEACLRTASGAYAWSVLAIGGYAPSLAQPRAP